MIKMQYVNELTGLRAPSETERKLVSDFFRIYYESKIRFRKRMSTALCVGGLVLLCSYPGAGVGAILLGLLCFVGAFNCISGKNGLKRRISLFERGQFRVLDGSVEQITVHPDKPGVSKVRFVSCYGQTLDNWFQVRQEGLNVGTHLLLAYADDPSLKQYICWAFTPFMLTAEGMRKNV